MITHDRAPSARCSRQFFIPTSNPRRSAWVITGRRGERLVDLVVRIGEMITYQAYNIQSPLDGEAAMWADMNPQVLPVDNRDIHPPDFD